MLKSGVTAVLDDAFFVPAPSPELIDAVMQAYEDCGNGNKSAIHWDMVLIQRKEWGGGEVWFDGELIRKDGIFLPKDLKQLNPQNLK